MFCWNSNFLLPDFLSYPRFKTNKITFVTFNIRIKISICFLFVEKLGNSLNIYRTNIQITGSFVNLGKCVLNVFYEWFNPLTLFHSKNPLFDLLRVILLFKLFTILILVLFMNHFHCYRTKPNTIAVFII